MYGRDSVNTVCACVHGSSSAWSKPAVLIGRKKQRRCDLWGEVVRGGQLIVDCWEWDVRRSCWIRGLCDLLGRPSLGFSKRSFPWHKRVSRWCSMVKHMLSWKNPGLIPDTDNHACLRARKARCLSEALDACCQSDIMKPDEPVTWLTEGSFIHQKCRETLNYFPTKEVVALQHHPKQSYILINPWKSTGLGENNSV